MSHLAKTLRAGAKAKAQARVGKAIRARKAYLPELAEAHKAMKKVRVRQEGGKVEGAKADVRADRKPRKADGGSLGERIMNAVPRRLRNRITPEEADVVAQSAMMGPTMLTGPSRAVAVGRRSRPLAEPVAEPMGNRPMPSGPVMDAVEAAPRWQMDPRTAAATLGAAALASGAASPPGDTPSVAAQATEPTASFVPSRPERRPVEMPPVAVSARATRPASVPRETLSADRLNEMSLAMGQGRPDWRNMAEQTAASNMLARRGQIEGNETTGGVSVPFDDTLLARKRGGAVKEKPSHRKGKAGKGAGNRAR